VRLRFTIDVDVDGETQTALDAALGRLLPALNNALDDAGYGWSQGKAVANVEILEDANA
jgi:hypothetical protein